ncbi:DUF2339 domain-containing protein [Thiorhodococcus mannitoliphagus]|uniref:DUF2339 domain-containing protein n=1 Tax=Thiorhodococcus mannitoliphagus TaxID=329406 RepID=A0A6P1DN04_9GAMM|nr:DUF2339 domain-containing protein [Thiorhodococcus mannitoliphagus]NEX19309.1 DUF2339 domain-containing protein [Thiorhodococcus mannitoliphagus]
MLITLLAALLGLAVGLWQQSPLLYALLGLIVGRTLALELRLRSLQARVTHLEPPRVQPQDSAAHTPTRSASPPDLDKHAEPAEQPLELDWPAPAVAKPISQPDGDPVLAPAPGARALDLARDWLATGNLFVRVGILLVFFGVAFLIKYAVDQEWLTFTLQLRLMAVALAGLGLLGLGWILRTRGRDYGLLLQGAAIGILYLDTYGAFQLAQLLQPPLAFALLALIGLTAATLAVAQNASALAWFGFAGGFLAPVITGAGNNDQVTLFGYYAVLNTAIFAVAWMRSWRALNLLGFGFTFGVAILWGVLRYDPSRFAITEPFLLLFFLFYVAIAVLYASRQPPRLRGYVDATLVFGTPIVTFACQIELVRHFEHGIATSSAALGGFYLLLSGGLRLLKPPGLKLLAQAFGVLGIIFLSVAVPFALAADTTAGVWALEGAGLIWIGSRQGRPLIRAIGLLLQAGAALSLIAGLPYPSDRPFINSAYLGAVMVASAGVVSAYWLDREDPSRRGWERGGPPWLLLWGLTWWLCAGVVELLQLDADRAFPANLLWYGVLTAVLSEAVASILPWPRLHRAQAALPLLGIAALGASIERIAHPGGSGGLAAWPAFLIAAYGLLWRVERRETRPFLAWSHVALALLGIAVLEWELLWRVIEQSQLASGWRAAAVAWVPLAALPLLTKLRTWPIGPWAFGYGVVAGSVLAFGLLLWALWSVRSAGDAGPLRWLPLFNPSDITFALVLAALWQWRRDLERRPLIRPTPGETDLFRAVFGFLAFLWVNLVLLRSLHHLWLIPYEWDALFRSDLTQTALAVLWGLVGVGLLLLARARRSRPLWIAGASVLAAAVVKLFAVDLAASGTIERIVSFLAVGGLLVGIGWWSPLPPRGGAREDERGVHSEAAV